MHSIRMNDHTVLNSVWFSETDVLWWCLIICHARRDDLVSFFSIHIQTLALLIDTQRRWTNRTAGYSPACTDIFQYFTGCLWSIIFSSELLLKYLPGPNEEARRWMHREILPLPLPTLLMWSTTDFKLSQQMTWDFGSLQGQGGACSGRRSLIGHLGWHSWWWTAQHAWLDNAQNTWPQLHHILVLVRT